MLLVEVYEREEDVERVQEWVEAFVARAINILSKDICASTAGSLSNRARERGAPARQGHLPSGGVDHLRNLFEMRA